MEGLTKEQLLAMKIGDIRQYDDRGPNSGPGHLIEIHRVYEGWIYVFKTEIRGISSTFVPEQVYVTKHYFDSN